jgi:hypothetical protein
MIPHQTVYSVLRNNIKLRSSRKYTLHEEFFRDIDTPEKAYFLGWLYSDGNLSSRSNGAYQISLKLKTEDSDILHQLARELEISNYSLHVRDISYSELLFCSKPLYNQLVNHGCPPAKTPLIRFPTWLQPDLQQYFCRGYFEGDGWICVGTRSRYDSGFYLNVQWGISSNLNFVGGMKSFLDSCLGINLIIHKRMVSKGVGLETNNKSSVPRLINFIYQDRLDLSLSRKLNKCNLARDLIMDKNLRAEWLTEQKERKNGHGGENNSNIQSGREAAESRIL